MKFFTFKAGYIRNFLIAFSMIQLLVTGAFSYLAFSNMETPKANAAPIYACPNGGTLSGTDCIAQNKTCPAGFNPFNATVCVNPNPAVRYFNVVRQGINNDFESGMYIRDNPIPGAIFTVPLYTGTILNVELCRRYQDNNTSWFFNKAWADGQPVPDCEAIRPNPRGVTFNQSTGQFEQIDLFFQNLNFAQPPAPAPYSNQEWLGGYLIDNVRMRVQITGDPAQSFSVFQKRLCYNGPCNRDVQSCAVIFPSNLPPNPIGCNTQDNIFQAANSNTIVNTEVVGNASALYQPRIIPAGWVDAGGDNTRQGATLTGYTTITAADVPVQPVCTTPINFGEASTCTATFAAGVVGTILFETFNGSCTTPVIVPTATSASCQLTPTSTVFSPTNTKFTDGTARPANNITVNKVPAKPANTNQYEIVQCGYNSANPTVADVILTNSFINCLVKLDPNYTLPAGMQLSVGISNLVGGTCTSSPGVIGTGTGAFSYDAICQNIPVGNVTGVNSVPSYASSTDNLPTIFDTGDKWTVVSNPITNTEIPGLTLVCGNLPSPLSAPVNSVTTCKFKLPVGKSLPNNLVFGIGTSTPGGSCVLNPAGDMRSEVLCSGVPTGTNTGLQSIYGQLGLSPKIDTGEKANITGIDLTKADIILLNLTCGNSNNSPILVNSLTECKFNLPIGKTLPANLTFGIDGATPGGTCTIENTNTGQVKCINVPTGSLTGVQPINAKIDQEPQFYTTKDATVGGSAITSLDIPSLTLNCGTGNQAIITFSTTTCTFAIPVGKFLPNNLKFGIGDSTPDGSCSLTSPLVTCINVPTGSETGMQIIYGQIGTAGKVDTGEKANVTGVLLTQIEISPLVLKCGDIDSKVIINSTTTCKFTLPAGKTLPDNLDFGIGNSTPGGNCAVTNSNIAEVTCTLVSTGTEPGLQIIYGQIGTDPKVDTGEKANVIGEQLKEEDLVPIFYNCKTDPNIEVYTNDITTCKFILPVGKILPTNLKIGIGDSTPAGNCTFSNINSGEVSCSNVPTGSMPGTQIIYVALGAGNKKDSGENVLVIASKLRKNQIPDLTVSCENNSKNAIFVNSTVTCIFDLPVGVDLPEDFKISIGDGDGVACTQNTTDRKKVTCPNVPTGTQPGLQEIFGTSGGEKISTGEKLFILKTLDEADIPSLFITCSVISGAIYVNETTTCSFDLPATLSLPSGLYLGIGDGAVTGKCQKDTSTSKVTCSNVPTGTKTGLQSIFAKINDNPNKTDTGEKVYVDSRIVPITSCEKGSFLDQNGKCSVCPVGYFCENGKSAIACDIGFTTLLSGATSKTDCVQIKTTPLPRTGKIPNYLNYSVGFTVLMFAIISTENYISKRKEKLESTWKK